MSHARLSWRKSHHLSESWDPRVDRAHAAHWRSHSGFGKFCPTVLHAAVTDRQIKCNFYPPAGRIRGDRGERKLNINRSHFTLGRRPGQRGNDNLNKNNNDNLTPKVEQTGQFGRETWQARLSERLIGLDSGHPRGDTPQPAGARGGAGEMGAGVSSCDKRLRETQRAEGRQARFQVDTQLTLFDASRGLPNCV